MNHHLRIFLTVLLSSLSIYSTGLQAAPPNVSAEMDSMIRTGKELMYDLKIREAEAVFQKVSEQFPEHPHGYVFQAYVSMVVFTMDESNEALGDSLKTMVDFALDVSNRYADKHKNNPDGYFYIAIASGIQAVYYVVDRSYLRAYWSGRRAKKNLEKVVKIDSTYYDAYIGLGMFHYYADLLPGFLKFFAGLLGFDGDRVKGKKELGLSAQQGNYFKFEGEFAFHSVGYFLEGEKIHSLRTFKQMLKKYPGNLGIALMIGYHYRRSGQPRECIRYSQGFDDHNSHLMPQITNIRYYNMAISYYLLNEFQAADSMFATMDKLPTRKSRYYQAAIAYYRGLLADLRFDRGTAVAFYQQIPRNKKTKYWHWISRSKLNYAMDSLMYRYHYARNLLSQRKATESRKSTEALKQDWESGQRSNNPDFSFHLYDLLGENNYYIRRNAKAKSYYDQIVPRLPKMKDEFHRAWIYMHYQRVLRKLKLFDEAEKMLDKAGDLDDDYTHIIIEREKFLLKKQRNRQ